jgi:hypothetical protein
LPLITSKYSSNILKEYPDFWRVKLSSPPDKLSKASDLLRLSALLRSEEESWIGAGTRENPTIPIITIEFENLVVLDSISIKSKVAVCKAKWLSIKGWKLWGLVGDEWQALCENEGILGTPGDLSDGKIKRFAMEERIPVRAVRFATNGRNTGGLASMPLSHLSFSGNIISQSLSPPSSTSAPSSFPPPAPAPGPPPAPPPPPASAPTPSLPLEVAPSPPQVPSTPAAVQPALVQLPVPNPVPAPEVTSQSVVLPTLAAPPPPTPAPPQPEPPVESHKEPELPFLKDLSDIIIDDEPVVDEYGTTKKAHMYGSNGERYDFIIKYFNAGKNKNEELFFQVIKPLTTEGIRELSESGVEGDSSIGVIAGAIPPRGENGPIIITRYNPSNYVFLDKFLSQKAEYTSFSTDKRTIAAINFAFGLKFLHDTKTIHRDIKPQNLLISQNDGSVKILNSITNALLSKEFIKVARKTLSVNYLAPETLDEITDEKTDIYSFALVLFEILTGSAVFPKTMSAGVIMRRAISFKVSDRPVIPQNIEKFKDIITKSWTPKPDKRLTADQIYETILKLTTE